MKKSLVTILFLLSSHLFAICPTDRSDYFCLSEDMVPYPPVSKEDFHFIPNQIISLFQQEISKLEMPVSLAPNWESPYFGAGVGSHGGKLEIMVLAGTVRIEGMNNNAYAALICHELGHIIGGPPLQLFPLPGWASIEGQSDYFAANTCLPRYFSSLGIEEDQHPQLIEAAGFDLFNTIKEVSTMTRDQQIIRGLVFDEEAPELVRGYPTMQCRYESFRNPSVRARCWFKEP